jgi:hypothetical protein
MGRVEHTYLHVWTQDAQSAANATPDQSVTRPAQVEHRSRDRDELLRDVDATHFAESMREDSGGDRFYRGSRVTNVCVASVHSEQRPSQRDVGGAPSE